MVLDVKGYSCLSKLIVRRKSDRQTDRNMQKFIKYYVALSVIDKLNCTVIIVTVVMMMMKMMKVMTMTTEMC